MIFRVFKVSECKIRILNRRGGKLNNLLIAYSLSMQTVALWIRCFGLQIKSNQIKFIKSRRTRWSL